MTSGAKIPGTIRLSTKGDLAKQAVDALAKSDPSRYWYRRVAIAARDLRAAAAACGRVATGAGPGEGIVWVVAPGQMIAAAGEPAAGAVVRLAGGAEAKVRGVRRSERTPGLVIVEVDGTLPPPIPLSRSGVSRTDVAILGQGDDLAMTPAVLVPASPAPRLETTASDPAGLRGAAIVSLSTGEVVGLVDAGGAVIPADRVLGALASLGIEPPRATMAQASAEDDEGFERRVDPSEYEDREGYDETFIGLKVPLPKPKGPLSDDALEYESTKGDAARILHYTHFSVVMSRSRRLSMFTAVNIAGKKLQELGRDGIPWRVDPRLPEDAQFDNALYVDNDLDRGHMVRRLDPVWGEDAEEANADTFHYTNSCPQHKDLNQKIWNDLEEYIYKNTGNEELKVNVFTGPVFGDDDPSYRGARIPLQYWKVVTMVRDDGKLSATAYILSQADMIEGLEFVFGEFRTYQLPIVKLEELTHLDFGDLRNHDPKRPSGEGYESVEQTFTPIASPKDLVL